MIISLNPTGGIFFAAVKSFNVNIAISGNFVLNATKKLESFRENANVEKSEENLSLDKKLNSTR